MAVWVGGTLKRLTGLSSWYFILFDFKMLKMKKLHVFTTVGHTNQCFWARTTQNDATISQL